MKLTTAQLHILYSQGGKACAERGGFAHAWEFGSWRAPTYNALVRAELLVPCDGYGKPLTDLPPSCASTYRLTGKGRCLVLQHLIEQAEARRDALLTLKVSLREPEAA